MPVPPADRYYQLPTKLRKTVEFLRYPREPHGIAEPMQCLPLELDQDKWFAEDVLKATKAVSQPLAVRSF